MSQEYTANDIQILTDQQHCKSRIFMYAGSTNLTTYRIPNVTEDKLVVENVTFSPAVYKVAGEIFDNSIDEFAQITKPSKILIINANPEAGEFEVTDNGRGVPIDMHPSGRYTPEVVFGSLRSGRNFDDSAKKQGVLGTFGIGSSLCNFTSEYFKVKIVRDGKQYEQEFTDGGETVNPPSISKISATTTGTQISFKLMESVFKNVSIPSKMMRNRAAELSLMNPGINVVYNGEKFSSTKGLREYVERICTNDNLKFHQFKIETDVVAGSIFVVLDATQSLDEEMYTWVNSSFLFDGGKCNTQFFNSFFDRVGEHLSPSAKKHKCEVTKNDIRQGLVVFANLKIKNPEYDSQAKTRLTGPDLRREIVKLVDDEWKMFARHHSAWLDSVLARAMERHHRKANKKAEDDHRRTIGKKIEGLLDATGTKRSECMLFCCEGLSAKATISDVRVPTIHAAYALTGKINNVFYDSVAEVLKMPKIAGFLGTIGLVPGKPAVRSQLRYGRIIIATDADVDGGHIFSLLVNLLYRFWPELFDPKQPPIVFRLNAPNVVMYKGDKRIHFPTRAEYESGKGKYKGWNSTYMKGLGSMLKVDWQLMMDDLDKYLIPFVDDGMMRESLHLHFSDDSDARKEWLSNG